MTDYKILQNTSHLDKKIVQKNCTSCSLNEVHNFECSLSGKTSMKKRKESKLCQHSLPLQTLTTKLKMEGNFRYALELNVCLIYNIQL